MAATVRLHVVAEQRAPAPPKSRTRTALQRVEVLRGPPHVALCGDPSRAQPQRDDNARLRRWARLTRRSLGRTRAIRQRPARRRALRPVWRSGGWVCQQTQCYYHLTGVGNTVNAPGCTLLVAARGPHSLRQIAQVAGSTSTTIDNIEDSALRALRASSLSACTDDDGVYHQAPTNADRALRALRLGATHINDIAAHVGIREESCRQLLVKLSAKGLVLRIRSHGASTWAITDAGRTATVPREPRMATPLRTTHAARIIAALAHGPATVTQLAAALALRPLTCYLQLTMLRTAGVVGAHRPAGQKAHVWMLAGGGKDDMRVPH